MTSRRAFAIALVFTLAAGCGSQRTADELGAAATGGRTASQIGASDDGTRPSADTVGTGDAGNTDGEGPTDPGADAVVTGGRAEAGRGAATPAAVGSGPSPRRSPTSPSAGTPTTAAPIRSADGTPNGPPIRIGAVGTLSGLGAVQRGTIVAVQAWAAWTNDHGGLNGHPVEVFVADDRGDAAQLRATVQNLVDVHHVVAIVGSVTGFSLSQATVDFLEKRRVPLVGGDRLSPLWYQSPMLFPQAAAADAAIWIQMLYVSRVAPKGAAVGWLVCREAQQCRDSDTEFPGYAKQLGLVARFNRQVWITQPDFTIECRQARDAGVEYLLLGLDVNSVRRVANDCAQQGYRPTYLSPQTAQSMATEAGFDKLLFASATFPWIREDDPATRRFHDALRTYAPDLELSAHSSSGWVSAVLFERAATSAIAAGVEPTAAAVLEGLWSIRDDTLAGLTAPLTFRRDKPAERRWCYFPMSIRSSRWTAGSTQISCQAPS